MEIITVLNLKGGVSKTTTTQNLACALRLQGRKVLTIDLDYQRNLSQLVKNNNVITSFDILTNSCKVEQAITGDNIGASNNLTLIDNLLNGQVGKEYRLKEALEPLESVYDYVLIDNHALLNTITINALTCSNKVIIPTTASYLALEGVNDLHKFILDIQKYTNPKLKIGGFLLVKYNTRTILSRDLKDSLEQIAKMYNTKIYKTYIRQNNAIEESQALKQDIFSYNPKSNGAIDYMNLAKEIIEEEN